MRKKPTKLALVGTYDRETTSISHDTLVAAAAQIVSAYIVNRPSESFNLTALTADVYATLRKLAEQELANQDSNNNGGARKPVVSVEESVKADYLVCLEDGKRVKMLKRHLKTAYNMSPEQYRARWNLPATYPMVAPNYAKVRSNLAKQIGLGRRTTSLSAAKQRMNAAAVNLR
jgi:predicted transcriptional regulator